MKKKKNGKFSRGQIKPTGNPGKDFNFCGKSQN